MSQPLPRLNNDDFIALRSLHKQSWLSAGILLWKENAKWLELNVGGMTPNNGKFTGGHRPDLQERALDAFDRLERRGFAKCTVRRCCPGTDCHLNDRLLRKVTDQGRALPERANASRPPSAPDDEVPSSTPAASIELSTRNRIAARFGSDSWDALISKLARGAKVIKHRWPDTAKEDAIAFHVLRAEAGLAMVWQGMNFVVGLPSSFSTAELSPDLLMDGTSGVYDDRLNPIACARWRNTQKVSTPMPRNQALAYRCRRALLWALAPALGVAGAYLLAYLVGVPAAEVLYKGSIAAGLMLIASFPAAFSLIHAPDIELPLKARPVRLGCARLITQQVPRPGATQGGRD